jgi:putative mycofactocin binding protein MftB
VAVQFDLDGAWALSPQVAVRPEPFGALMYHFGTRGLTFVKNPTMLAVVRGLAAAPSARRAAQDAGVSEAALPAYAEALARLARLQMIQPRAGQASAEGSVREHATR